MVVRNNYPRKREGESGAMAAFLLSKHLGKQSNDGQPNRLSAPESHSLFSASSGLIMGTSLRYPVTTEGRMLGIFLMVTGVGMFGGLSGLVASLFLGASTAKTDKSDEILARLSQLEAKLDGGNAGQRASERPTDGHRASTTPGG